MAQALHPLPGRILVDQKPLERWINLDVKPEVGPLDCGVIVGVSEEASSKGLRLGDAIWFETHQSSGFEVEGRKYLSVPVEHVVGQGPEAA